MSGCSLPPSWVPWRPAGGCSLLLGLRALSWGQGRAAGHSLAPSLPPVPHAQDLGSMGTDGSLQAAGGMGAEEEPSASPGHRAGGGWRPWRGVTEATRWVSLGADIVPQSSARQLRSSVGPFLAPRPSASAQPSAWPCCGFRPLGRQRPPRPLSRCSLRPPRPAPPRPWPVGAAGGSRGTAWAQGMGLGWLLSAPQPLVASQRWGLGLPGSSPPGVEAQRCWPGWAPSSRRVCAGVCRSQVAPSGRGDSGAPSARGKHRGDTSQQSEGAGQTRWRPGASLFPALAGRAPKVSTLLLGPCP